MTAEKKEYFTVEEREQAAKNIALIMQLTYEQAKLFLAGCQFNETLHIMEAKT